MTAPNPSTARKAWDINALLEAQELRGRLLDVLAYFGDHGGGESSCDNWRCPQCDAAKLHDELRGAAPGMSPS